MLKDPNSILSDLAQLSDPQLESVKQIYKNDPFIPSAANSELVRRASFKKRFGGIAQLPAQNMQTLAGGGIVAFADEGFVQEESNEQAIGGADNDKLGLSLDAARAQLQAANNLLGSFGLKRRKQDPEGYAAAVEAQAQAQAMLTDAQRAYEGGLRSNQGNIYGPITRPLTAQTSVRMPAGPAVPAAAAAAAAAAPTSVEQAAAAARTAAGAPGAAPAAPAAVPGSTSVSATMRGPAGAPGAGAFSYPVSKALEEAAALQKGVPEALAPLFKAERERRETQNKATEDFYEKNKPKGKAYESYEKALLEERGRSADAREEAKNDAIVRAGLAMMGSKRRDFLGAAGESLMEGHQAYGAAKKELAAQDKERTKALAMIEQARRLEERGDFEAAAKRRAEGLGRLDAVYNAELTTQAGLITETPKVAGQLRAAGLKIEGDILQESMRNAAYMAVARMRESAGAGGISGARLQQEAIKQSVDLTEKILGLNPALAKNPEAVNALRQGIYMNIMQQLGQPGGAAPSGGALKAPTGYNIKDVTPKP